MAEYVLSPMAVDELVAIWDTTAETWGVSQADRYTEDLDARCAWLALNPYQGKARDDVLHGVRSFPEGAHMVYYAIVEEGFIEILRFVHQRQDVARLFSTD